MATISYDEYSAKVQLAQEHFVPFQPIRLVGLLKGRIDIINRLVIELTSPGRHAVLYGDRGVGKTSLANLLYFFINHSEDATFTTRCSSASSFDSLFADILRQAGVTEIQSGRSLQEIGRFALNRAPFDISTTFSDTASFSPLSPFEISPQFVAQKLGPKRSLIIIDEYDRLEDVASNIALADLIKHLSDDYPSTHILVVGVAASVSALLGSHASISRCVAEVPLDRMPDDAIREILDDGFKEVGIRCQTTMITRVIRLSDGFPHFAHLLGLRLCIAVAARCADNDGQRLTVSGDDYRVALRDAISGSNESLRTAYDCATMTTHRKSDLFHNVLEGVALSDSREVQVNEIVSNLNYVHRLRLKTQSISYHLGQLVRPERSSLLSKPRAGYYAFSDPMMRAFVRLKLELHNYEVHSGQQMLPFMSLENRRAALES